MNPAWRRWAIASGYADLLLEMAAVVDGSQGRLRRHALTMAASSHIRQRIDSLLQEGRTFSRGLTWTGWAAVMLCGIPLVLGAGAVQFARRPLADASGTIPRNQSSEETPCRNKRRWKRSRCCWRRPGRLRFRRHAPSRRLRPRRNSTRLLSDAAWSGTEMAEVAGVVAGAEVSRYLLRESLHKLPECVGNGGHRLRSISRMSLSSMIPGCLWTPKRIRGGPAWIHSDYYTIDAKTDDPVANGPNLGPTPANTLMRGAMLRALLEDRFQLKTHRAVEEIPMYALTVASGGLKMQPMEEGGCTRTIPRKVYWSRRCFLPARSLCV